MQKLRRDEWLLLKNHIIVCCRPPQSERSFELARRLFLRHPLLIGPALLLRSRDARSGFGMESN